MIAKIQINIFILCLSYFLTSCSIYNADNSYDGIIKPDYNGWESVSMEVNNPCENCSSASCCLRQSPINDKWWNTFEDANLDSIMMIFLSNNYDLK